MLPPGLCTFLACREGKLQGTNPQDLSMIWLERSYPRDSLPQRQKGKPFMFRILPKQSNTDEMSEKQQCGNTAWYNRHWVSNSVLAWFSACPFLCYTGSNAEHIWQPPKSWRCHCKVLASIKKKQKERLLLSCLSSSQLVMCARTQPSFPSPLYKGIVHEISLCL